MEEIAIVYSRLINQFKNQYQTVFPARFDEKDEDDQVVHEIEFVW